MSISKCLILGFHHNIYSYLFMFGFHFTSFIILCIIIHFKIYVHHQYYVSLILGFCVVVLEGLVIIHVRFSI